ncbi:hypothetical protein [Rhizobium sp. MHM7A]|uniref:hypothetical protein n=1 Tax=Rhizobium sp. MHM7A TaxID=2583233 RepID=UPI001105CB44|nr:hypothetical protein [Rhizobium sp. MHM7A]TLX16987.1 hypothetical protein FFR93_06615 [Rhizobium sp. MHM7A]
MNQETIQLIDAKQVVYQHFDADPDGDPDRAGHGLYFQLPGESSWSGPWHSEDEAEGEAYQALEAQEVRDLIRDLESEGYLCVEKNSAPERISFINKIDDRWFAIDVTADRVRARETFGFGQNKIVELFDFEPSEDVFGYRRRAAKQAVDAIAQEIANQPTMKM